MSLLCAPSRDRAASRRGGCALLGFWSYERSAVPHHKPQSRQAFCWAESSRRQQLGGGTLPAFGHTEKGTAYNDVAVAARHAQEVHGVGRIAVIDLMCTKGMAQPKYFKATTVFT